MEPSDAVERAVQLLENYAREMEELRRTCGCEMCREVGPIARYPTALSWITRRLELASFLAGKGYADAALAILRGVVEKAFAEMFLDAMFLNTPPEELNTEDAPHYVIFENAYALGIWGLLGSLNSVGPQDFQDKALTPYLKIPTKKGEGYDVGVRQVVRRIYPEVLRTFAEALRDSGMIEEPVPEVTPPEEDEVDLLTRFFEKVLQNSGGRGKKRSPEKPKEIFSVKSPAYSFQESFMRYYSRWACEEHAAEVRQELYRGIEGKSGGLLGVREEQLEDISFELVMAVGERKPPRCEKCGEPAKVGYLAALPSVYLISKVLDQSLDEDLRGAVAQELGHEKDGYHGDLFEKIYYRTYNKLNTFAHPDVAPFLDENSAAKLQSIWSDISREVAQLLVAWTGAMTIIMRKICGMGEFT